MRPRLELTTFSQPVDGRTDVVDALTKTGVPKSSIGQAYKAAGKLTWINLPGRWAVDLFR